MKRYEWFNKLENKTNSVNEQAKGMIRAYSDETGEDLLDVYEERIDYYRHWLMEEVDENGKILE